MPRADADSVNRKFFLRDNSACNVESSGIIRAPRSYHSSKHIRLKLYRCARGDGNWGNIVFLRDGD